MKKLFLAFILLFSLTAGAQELRNHFTVPGRIENNILFNFWQNPALTGYEERMNVQGGYGMRWLGLPGYDKNGSPQNWFTTVDAALGKSKRSSLGLVYLHNQTVYEKKMEFMLTYSYTFKIGKYAQLRIGHSASYIIKKSDWSNLAFGDQLDARYGWIYPTNEAVTKESRSFPDFNHGLWFARKHLFLGFSVLHSTQPDEGYYGVSKLPIQFYYNAGYHVALSNSIVITPSIIVTHKTSYPTSKYYVLTPSISLAIKNRFLLMASYRNLNTIMAYAGAQLKENLRISCGWGFPVSKELRAIQTGQGFEVTLRYRFKMRKDATPEEQMKITKP
jgi:type IX secretion system PorP/SprF family membrane protein